MVRMCLFLVLATLTKGRKVSLILFVMLFSAASYATQIDVSVDRNPVAITDSFQLTFTAHDTPDDDPDFSPLKQNFDIINQQKSSQSSWINGKSSKTIQWTLSLMAKHLGNVQIPTIAFGDDVTTPLNITVNDVSNTSTNKTDELFLEVETSTEQAYVQSQIVYTVRLFQRVNIAQASLSEPETDNAVIEKLGDDSTYTTQVKGISYRVTERKYALFPQQSGQLTIAPLVLTAQIITNDPQSRFNRFFSTQATQTKRVLSRAINLTVLPAAKEFTGDLWLPAEQLKLSQTWSNDDLHVTVGEPLTRTISLQAKGITASQLPKLTMQQDNSKLKLYPDQAELNDKVQNNSVIANRQQKIAIIPTTAGQYTLPAIEIPWFNTHTNKMELAQLPAVTITAIASAKSVVTPAPTMLETTAPQTASTTQQPTSAGTVSTPSPTHQPIWMWLALFFGIAWLSTMGWLWRTRIAKVTEKEVASNESVTLHQIIKAIKTACNQNDPKAVQAALIQWGGITYNAHNLASLTQHCNDELKQELTLINQCLYAQEEKAWNGQNLLHIFTEYQAKQQNKKVQDEPLEPLYRI